MVVVVIGGGVAARGDDGAAGKNSVDLSCRGVCASGRGWGGREGRGSALILCVGDDIDIDIDVDAVDV